MKMKRRDFMSAMGLGTAALMTGRTGAADQERPNLLIIETDEHHFNTLGCYGGTIVGTPNIDWLAKQGARCERFYATTPVCSPSRAALVSGRYPHNTPVETNNIPLDDGVVTFAEILRRQGYATGYAGKWHLDGTGKPQWGPKRKFGFEDNRFMFNRGHWKKLEDGDAGPRVGARNAQGRGTHQLPFEVPFVLDYRPCGGRAGVTSLLPWKGGCVEQVPIYPAIRIRITADGNRLVLYKTET